MREAYGKALELPLPQTVADLEEEEEEEEEEEVKEEEGRKDLALDASVEEEMTCCWAALRILR